MRYQSITNKIPGVDLIYEPNHPWLGGIGSKTWWNTVYGYDETGFVILEIGDQIRNVKSLGKGNFYLQDANNQPVPSDLKSLTGVDARLLHLYGDYFLFSYNKYIVEGSVKDQTCEKGCFLICARILRLDNRGNLSVGKENVLCPQISNSVEKNWSFWGYNDRVFFSYGLAPKHSFYVLQIDMTRGDIVCSPYPNQEAEGYYGYFEEKYNNNGKFLHISLTTPALRYNRDRYIGIGHVKYANDQKYIDLVQTSPLANFFTRMKNFKRHPALDYLMFIYEFDPRSGEVLRITDMFLPEDTDYVLGFPSGLEYAPDGDVMISYGDHDSFCKIVKIKREIVERMLKPVSMKPVSKLYIFSLYRKFVSIRKMYVLFSCLKCLYFVKLTKVISLESIFNKNVLSQ